MDHRAVSDISRLPPQLLAQVLQHVDPAHRLQSAAVVCKTWQLAAVMATSDIQIQILPPKCASFSAWLHSNSALAAVSSINITCWGDNVDHTPQLELPAQQLQDLCSLSCSGLLLTAAGANSSSEGRSSDPSVPPPPAPFLTPALASLTRLELVCGTADLQGLQTLTALQHLRFSSPEDASVDSVNKLGTPAALAEALPELRCLTFLGLSGPVCSDTVQHLRCLQRLAVLDLEGVSCSVSCFLQLPPSLQHVTIAFNDPEPVISPSSTPGFSQLTALVELSLSHAAAFDTGMLASLTCLTQLELSVTPLTAPEGQFRFKALADLKHPHLQSLVLDQDVFDVAELTGTELAALVAPTGLRQLVLGTGHQFVEPQEYSLMFTADRQLPFLSKLVVGVGLLGNPAAVQHMVKGCPNLQQLTCAADVQDDPLEIQPSHVTRSLASLTGLTALQKLDVCDRDLHLRQESYKAIATLTGLKHLQLEARRAYNLYSIVALTACRQLESLRFTSVAVDPPFEVGDVVLDNRARPGAPPDVWFRLPAALMEAVDRLVLAEDGAENPLLMRCLVQTTAAVHAHDMRLLQEEHNQQIIALTKQLVDCKKRLTEQEKDYRAQLGAVCRQAAEGCSTAGGRAEAAGGKTEGYDGHEAMMLAKRGLTLC